MSESDYKVLFLCNSNSARSQIAEVLLNHMAGGRFTAYSAGANPSGNLQPLALELIRELGYSTDGLRSKSWSEFASVNAPELDFVISLCDTAAGETCPVWPGHPVLADWSVPDPARVPGDRQAFKDAWVTIHRRIELLLALPLEKLDRLAREKALSDVKSAG